MSVASSIYRHVLVCCLSWKTFLPWYFWEMPCRIVLRGGEYMRAFAEMFSFSFMLRTLLSPWKNIRDAYPTKGLDISAFAQALTLNVTTRVIGFIFRIVAFIIGFLAELLVVIVFLACVGVWLAFPFFLVWGIYYLIPYYI